MWQRTRSRMLDDATLRSLAWKNNTAGVFDVWKRDHAIDRTNRAEQLSAILAASRRGRREKRKTLLCFSALEKDEQHVGRWRTKVTSGERERTKKEKTEKRGWKEERWAAYFQWKATGISGCDKSNGTTTLAILRRFPRRKVLAKGRAPPSRRCHPVYRRAVGVGGAPSQPSSRETRT